MDTAKVMSIIGFANRAGKCAIGRSAVIGAFKKQRLVCVILAADASDKLNKLEQDIDPTPVYVFSTKGELAGLFGRNDLAVIGITDINFAKSLRKYLG